MNSMTGQTADYKENITSNAMMIGSDNIIQPNIAPFQGNCGKQCAGCSIGSAAPLNVPAMWEAGKPEI
jgi:hypothetical protein